MQYGPDGSLLIETAAEKEARERAEEQRTDRRNRKLQLWFNGALMLASILTVGLLLYQNHIFNRTLTEMQTQSGISKTAADATTVAARAAENQLPLQLGQLDVNRQQQIDRIESGKADLAARTKAANDAISQARETLRQEQRAWIGFSSFQLWSRPLKTTEWLRREPIIGDEFMIRYGLTNTGNTPATHVWANRNYIVGLPNAITLPSPPVWRAVRAPIEGTSVVFPNAVGHYIETQPEVFNKDFDVPYREGKSRLMTWIRVNYCDVSGRRHWVELCVSHPFGPEGSLSLFNFCGSGVSPTDTEPSPDCKR